jgi:uncharacterized membrane protein
LTGAVWAAAAGVGFEALNRRAERDIDDPHASTFLLLAIGAMVLSGACLVTGEVSRIGDAAALDLILVSCAGLMNFLAGWWFLNLSHRRVGAARTSVLLTTSPLFGAVAAALVFDDVPSVLALGAIVPMLIGAYLISAPGAGGRLRAREALPGLSTALMWGWSPIFAVEGLDGLNSPLAGSTIGILAAAAGYSLVYLGRGASLDLAAMDRTALAFKCAAAVLVALATWSLWLAFDAASVATVLSLNLLSVPVVLVLAPLLVGRQLENVNARVCGFSAGRGRSARADNGGMIPSCRVSRSSETRARTDAAALHRPP